VVLEQEVIEKIGFSAIEGLVVVGEGVGLVLWGG
jgi:hypothetical protein